MTEQKAKRIRSMNWDEEERQLFRSILRDYSHIIEEKSLNANSNKSKTKAWEAVHQKFNELNSRPRDLRQLQTQWKHMKMNARKVYSDYTREQKKTGGGQGPTIPDEIVMEIKDIMNPAELLRDHNVYDSDGPIIQLSTYEEPSTSEEVDTQLKIFENDILSPMESEEFTEVESEHVEIKEMKQFVNEGASTSKGKDIPCISTPIRKNFKNVERKISKKDQEYVASMVQLSTELKEKEHNKYMEFLEIEHKRRMRIMAREHRMVEKEHSLKKKVQEETLKNILLQRENIKNTNKHNEL
ncbi:unnamed protein product [Diabrotica balteata]|uniref:Regulatory protein zeste n=1 Tax=Diabrotica balteata TaxID=107213 RepID=A0A9N9X992_DIABA|nr:unnamed protein product [Diabrotica balteata]